MGEGARMKLPVLDAAQVRAARARAGLVAIFDLDGTLAPIAPTPARARVPAAARRALHRLARCPGTVVGVVSGRPLAQVSRLLDARGLWLAGVHGAVRRRPGGPIERLWSDDVRRAGARLTRALTTALRTVPGVLVEPKGPVVAVHTRAATPAIRARVHEVVRRLRPPGWVLLEGRRVAELRPRGLPTKADAVRWIAASHAGAPVLYVGDDATDEDAFKILGRRDFPVVVDPARASAERSSAAPTRARYTLGGPGAVHRLVGALCERDPQTTGR
jgi:trehalose 6-phosphate phosphatase